MTAKPFLNKVFCVTGAAQGIGKATARYLAARGANVAIADVKRHELEETLEGIQKDFPDIEAIATVVDVSDSHSVKAWFEEIMQTFEKLDGGVNNAGIMGQFQNLGDLTDENWQHVQQINAGGVMRCMREELKVLPEEGSIVNISSVAGMVGFAGMAPYVASKHAVIGLTKAAAKEVAGKKIRVNAICPGPIETPMIHAAGDVGVDLRPTPMGRNGEPEEIAALIGYLLGPESKYTSGSCIPVDGAGYVC